MSLAAMGTILAKDPYVMVASDMRNHTLELVIEHNHARITVYVRGEKLADLIRFALLAKGTESALEPLVDAANDEFANA